MQWKALAAILLAATGASAQTVYKCGNVYTDEPCAKNAQTVDILPTEGVESMSGTRHRSVEVEQRKLNRTVDKTMDQIGGLPEGTIAKQRAEHEAEQRKKAVPRIPVEQVKPAAKP